MQLTWHQSVVLRAPRDSGWCLERSVGFSTQRHPREALLSPRANSRTAARAAGSRPSSASIVQAAAGSAEAHSFWIIIARIGAIEAFGWMRAAVTAR